MCKVGHGVLESVLYTDDLRLGDWAFEEVRAGIIIRSMH